MPSIKQIILFIAICSSILFSKDAAFFATDSYTLTQSEKRRINIVMQQAQVSEDVHIIVKGYADQRGSSEHNKRISELRALKVVQYLVENFQVDLEQIKVFGMGELETDAFSSARKVEVFVVDSLEDINEYDNSISSKEKKSDLSIESSTKKKQKTNNLKSLKYRFYVGGGIYNNVLESNDRGSSASAEWVSHTHWSMKTAHQVQISDVWWIGPEIAYITQNYRGEDSASFVWDEEQPRLWNFTLRNDIILRSDLVLGVDLDYHQKAIIFERLSTVSLRTPYFLGPKVRLNYEWFNKNNWKSHIGIAAAYPFLAFDNISSRGLYAWSTSAMLQRSNVIGPFGVQLRALYGEESLRNSQNDQDEQMLQFELRFVSQYW